MMILLAKIAVIMVLCGAALAFTTEALSELMDYAPKWVYKTLSVLCVLFLTLAFIGMATMFAAMLIAIWN